MCVLYCKFTFEQCHSIKSSRKMKKNFVYYAATLLLRRQNNILQKTRFIALILQGLFFANIEFKNNQPISVFGIISIFYFVLMQF
jgi:hypothetical protein